MPPWIPPAEYEVDQGHVLLYRRVSRGELEELRRLGEFRAPEGGMALGKHFTCSVEHALAWGRAFVERGWEDEVGHVLRVRIATSAAAELHFDPSADGIGPQCFAPFSALVGASIEELS